MAFRGAGQKPKIGPTGTTAKALSEKEMSGTKRFLFRFGYCPPKLWNYDAEDSSCFVIECELRDDAIRWGLEVAERFNQYLFESDSDWNGPIPSWRSCEFAYWLEDVSLRDRVECDSVVYVGELPDFRQLL